MASEFVCVNGEFLRKSEIEAIGILSACEYVYSFKIQVHSKIWMYTSESEKDLRECRN